MIGFLKGNVKDIIDMSLILDVNGVGYLIESTREDILLGQEIELYIYTHVRETEIKLFGFRDKPEIDIFAKLISVNGVGPKSALTLIKANGINKIIEGVRNEDSSKLKASGIGLKTSKKIILELKGKLDLYPTNNNQENVGSIDQKRNTNVVSELSDALLGLGYSEKEVEDVVEKLDFSVEEENVQTMLRKALTELRK